MNNAQPSLDFEDYPDPREYYDPKESLDQEEIDRSKIIGKLEKELLDLD